MPNKHCPAQLSALERKLLSTVQKLTREQEFEVQLIELRKRMQLNKSKREQLNARQQ